MWWVIKSSRSFSVFLYAHSLWVWNCEVYAWYQVNPLSKCGNLWDFGPSVTLQMALLVKVGHGRTLPSTQDGTMEITGVWSPGLNTVWGRQDTGRGTLPWSLHRTTVVSSTSRNYKTRDLSGWEEVIWSVAEGDWDVFTEHKISWVESLLAFLVCRPFVLQ